MPTLAHTKCFTIDFKILGPTHFAPRNPDLVSSQENAEPFATCQDPLPLKAVNWCSTGMANYEPLSCHLEVFTAAGLEQTDIFLQRASASDFDHQ